MMNEPQFDTLREKIAWQKAERLARYERFAETFLAATRAGQAAFDAAEPEAMVVQRHANQFDPESSVVQEWVEPEGICGFAWVNVSPATSSFARWLVKGGHAVSVYGGGVNIWTRNRSQSYERKMAYAHAMADVLRASPDLAGLRIYAGGRVD